VRKQPCLQDGKGVVGKGPGNPLIFGQYFEIMKLLLLSNSTNFGETYMHHSINMIREFMGQLQEVLFIPYAAVRFGYDEYENKVNEAFQQVGMGCVGIHRYADPVRAVDEAQAIAIGGGNTFKLLAMLYHYFLLEPIYNKVMSGVPYMGWSAGANVACATIKTTNDMPIVEPPSFQALGLVPFQINPHYTEEVIPGHNGEPRIDRILEFIEENPNVYVAGLPEGTALKVEDQKVTLMGNKSIKVFRKLEEIKELGPGAYLDFLFHP
jgi:dipeptidase E